MDRALHCNCGFVARAAGEDGLVAEVQRHAREAHGMALTRAESLVLVFRAELDENALTTTPPGRTTPARTIEEEQ